MKKYAVYKSDTGYYFCDYIDSLDALENTDFKDIISEKILPVILDGRGGYSRFSENDIGFQKIVETDEYPPLKIEEMFFKNHPDFRLGWMSPEGDTYSCSYTNHTKCARFLANEFFSSARFPETMLQRGGWLKIIDSWDGIGPTHRQYVNSDIGYITRKQADRLFDLGLYENDEVKELIRKNENKW